eukprot:gene8082-8947_t
MVGVLLESMTKKQISLFTLAAFASVVIFFTLGGTKVSTPASAMLHIATACDATGKSWKNTWYRRDYQDGKKTIKDKHAPCKAVPVGRISTDAESSKKSYVFSVHMPHPGMQFHPYHQFLVASMNAEIEHPSQQIAEVTGKTKACTIHYKTKVGYRAGENDTWTFLAESKEKRPLRCVFASYSNTDQGEDYTGYYTCEDMHFMELGSTPHPYYLINLQITEETECFGTLQALHFVEIHQNPSYTWSWFTAKTIVAPFLIAALIFFVRRVRCQPRPPILLEKVTGALGFSLLFLVFPFDWLSLVVDMPFMLLLSDIRQGQFYAFLLCFWCIFAGEHILDQQKRGSWKCYKWQLILVSLGCASLLIFDLVERGVQLRNPFHTIWKKDSGETAAKGFIIFAAICAGLFVIFFTALVFRVFRHMSIKGRAMPVMQEARRLYYQGVIYRFRVLVGITLFCAISTVLCFILDQVNEGHWKFIEDNPINDVVKLSSALHFGTFGLWNIYIISVLILYSPVLSSTDGSVRYRVGTEGEQDELALDGGSADSSELPEGSMSVVYQLSGQHIKE